VDWWTGLAVGYNSSRYTESTRDDVQTFVTNHFKFQLWGLTHFVDHTLTQVQTVIVYRREAEVHGIKEEYVPYPDVQQEFVYSAFAPLAETGLFLTFSFKTEDSLKAKAFRDRQALLKISFKL